MEKQTLYFERHISDSEENIEVIVDACRQKSASILLTAPCNSGKTYAMLHCVARELEGERRIILAVPNTVQAEQEGQKDEEGNYSIIPVTGTSGTDFSISDAPAVSVYDSLYRLQGMEDLGRIILAIDEAHLLIEARDWRRKAISSVLSVAGAVQAAGGTVIYMTGTPDKLGHMRFDSEIAFFRVDENGDPCPLTMAEQIHLVGTHGSMKDSIARVISQETENRNKVLVRYNNKQDLQDIAAGLREHGVKAAVLTADEKGYIICDDGSISYDSPVYEHIIRDSVLPADFDAYLFTSILEVGTSIKGFRDRDGSISQPEDIICLYACHRPEDCDLDKIQQFFSRVRYPFRSGYILFHGRKECDRPARTYEELYSAISYEAKLRAEDYSQSEFLAFSRNLHGEKDQENLNRDTAEGHVRYAVDSAAVSASAWKAFYQQGYYNQQFFAERLEERFGIPVSCSSLEKEEDTIHVEHEVRACSIDAAVRQVLEDVFQSPFRTDNFRKAILRETGINFKEQNIASMLEHSSDVAVARKLLSATRDAAMIHDVDIREAAAIGIHFMENPDRAYTDNGRCISDIGKEMEEQAYMEIGRWTADRVLFITGDAVSDLSEESRMLIRCIEKNQAKYKYFRDICRLRSGYITSNRDWKSLCTYFASHRTAECKMRYTMEMAIVRNTLKPGTPMYHKHVSLNQIAGAEYDLIRNPQGRFFDAEGNDIFPDGMIGKTVSPERLKLMAAQFCSRICELTHKHTTRQYSPNMVKMQIKAIYRCSIKKNGTMEVRGLRTNLTLEQDKAGCLEDCDDILAAMAHGKGTDTQRKESYKQILIWLRRIVGKETASVIEPDIYDWVYHDKNYENGMLLSLVEGLASISDDIND